MRDVNWVFKRDDETLGQFAERMKGECPNCGDSPFFSCCPCGCHEYAWRTLEELGYEF